MRSASLLAIVAGAALLVLAWPYAGRAEYVAALFYVVSLTTVFSVSCAYNLWPITPTKWLLRRFDHAAIYLLIAGTYSPFLALLDEAGFMLAMVWGAAASASSSSSPCPAASTGWPSSSISRSAGAGCWCRQPGRDAVLAHADAGRGGRRGLYERRDLPCLAEPQIQHGPVARLRGRGAALHLAAVTDALVLNIS
jgi:hypothetical protein